jgi:hypothetical protein
MDLPYDPLVSLPRVLEYTLAWAWVSHMTDIGVTTQDSQGSAWTTHPTHRPDPGRNPGELVLRLSGGTRCGYPRQNHRSA